MTRKILQEMKLDFFKLFTPYNFPISTIGGNTIFSVLNLYETLSFINAFKLLIFNPNYGKNISVKSFMINNFFTSSSFDYIDKLCRLTDGADSSNYTLFQFLQLANQQFFYKLYQPNTPTDLGLFNYWEKYLEETGNVTILKNSYVKKLNIENNIINNIDIENSQNFYKIFGKKFIMCIPPENMIDLLNNSNINDNYITSSWVNNSSYINYISITFHYKNKFDIPKKWGFPNTKWGIVYIILTDYMKCDDKSEIVISLAITVSNVLGYNNKYPKDCNEQELINEVYLQLKNYLNLEFPDKYIIHSIQDNWKSLNSAFVRSAKENNFIPYFTNKNIKNLFNVGTQNGNSKYHFTSLESAISNAISYIHKEIKQSKNDFKIESPFTLIYFIYILFILFILILIILKYFYRH